MLTASIAVGVVVSVVLTELIGLSAGGIIAPGYVALLLDRPRALATLILLALACFALVRLAALWIMLYGSRRFGAAVVVGLALSTGLAAMGSGIDALPLEWSGIGYIVPGLVAHQFDRQGIWQTLLMLAIAAPIVRLIVLIGLGWWG